MKQQVPQEFQKLHSIFRSRSRELPDTVKNQLLFISAKLFDQPFNIDSLSIQNVKQIQQLSRNGKRSLLILFKTLINAFLHQKQKIETVCKVKFNGFFEFWKEGKVVVNDQKIIFFSQKNASKYNLNQITIVNCRASKKFFDVVLKNQTLATVKCQSLESYNNLIDQIQSRIDKLREIQSNNNKPMNVLPKINQGEFTQIIAEQISVDEELIFKNNVKQSKNRESKEVKQDLNFIQLLKGQKPQGFQIAYQTQNMLIFESKSLAKLKISMVLSCHIELDKVVNFYLQQKEWNSFVVSQKIQEIQDNMFRVFRVYKKESFFQYERGSFSNITIFCTKNTANLTEKSQKIDKKQGKLNCEVTSDVKLLRFMGGIKINIESSFDAKGFYQTKDSAIFLQKLFGDIKFFENNLKINQIQSNKMNMLIKSTKALNLSPNKQPQINFNYQNRTIGNKEIANQGTSDSLDSIFKTEKKQYKPCQFSKLRPINPTIIPSLSYIHLVQNKQFQKCYLNARFDQQINKKYDDYTPSYCLSQLLKRKQYSVSKNKELVFVDYDVIKGQKNSLLFVIRQVGANIISGKSVLNVSLPVDIFEARTLLERSAACFGMAPDYLIPIADADPLTQIKNIVTLFSHIPTLELVMLKPFNPILGQTFQAYIKGIPIYYEQISHHPPISSFYMTCPQFTMYGNLVAFADLSLNSAVGGNEGITYIKMRNGSEFQCYFPPCEISGLIFGNRTFRAYGKGFILQKNHSILAEISIEKDKKGLYEKGDQKLYPGDLIGGIFKVQPKAMEQLARQPSLRKYTGLEKKNMESKLGHIRGTWFEQIRIDGQVMNKDKKIYPLEYQEPVLPSDANYRQDVLYHKIKDIPQSQCNKQILQTRQRCDRKLRQKHAKILKKQQK